MKNWEVAIYKCLTCDTTFNCQVFYKVPVLNKKIEFKPSCVKKCLMCPININARKVDCYYSTCPSCLEKEKCLKNTKMPEKYKVCL